MISLKDFKTSIWRGGDDKEEILNVHVRQFVEDI